MEISVLNQYLVLDYTGVTESIQIGNITSLKSVVAREEMIVSFLKGTLGERTITIKFSEVTSPVFADFAAMVTWFATNVKVITDVSELTDTTGIIPTDVSDLTDNAGIIPIDITDLTDTTDLLNKCLVHTYSELESLISGSDLIVGQNYLLSDFAQSYNIFDGGTMEIFEEKVGALEPLILKAIATNKFDKVAISPLRPNDIIHYSFDILDIRDIGFGNGVDTVNANFKGQIYYRKDTIQNVETHYDFRNIKFRRWAVDAVAYDNGAAYVARDVCKASNGKIYKCITATTGEGDPTVNTADWILWLDITADAFVSWTADKTLFNVGNITTTNLIINNVTAGVDYDDFYTFGDYYNYVFNISIGMIDLEYTIGYLGYNTILNNTVFKTTNIEDTCINSNFKKCFNNTFKQVNNANAKNAILYNNVVANSCINNVFIDEIQKNMINQAFMNNTITYFANNTIGEEFIYNIVNVFNTCNTGYRFQYNKLYIINNIEFGDDFVKNIFNYQNSNKRIKIGDDVTMCTFQDNCFGALAADLDLSAATHIRGAYHTTIYQDKTDGVKLSYMDGGVPQYVDVTD